MLPIASMTHEKIRHEDMKKGQNDIKKGHYGIKKGKNDVKKGQDDKDMRR